MATPEAPTAKKESANPFLSAQTQLKEALEKLDYRRRSENTLRNRCGS